MAAYSQGMDLCLSGFLSDTAEFLFPGGCLLCGASLYANPEPFSPVCSTCAAAVFARRISSPRCRICGAVITSEDGVCLRCREKEYSFDSHTAPFFYSGGIKFLLSAYKGAGRRDTALFLAAVVVDYCEKVFPGLPLVPVPSRPAALRRRGFDNTGLICRHLEKRCSTETLDVLKRANGSQQKSLGYHERFLNIRGKISLKKPVPHHVQHVVLFDDVFTSGATADACAAVLKHAGVKRVDVLTIAQD